VISLLDQTVQESCDTVEISTVRSGDYVVCTGDYVVCAQGLRCEATNCVEWTAMYIVCICKPLTTH